MRVRCLSKLLNSAQREKIGLPPGGSVEHAITPESEYVVLGLSVKPCGSPNGSGAFVYVVNDWGQCRAISICLFDVVESRCSKYWHAKRHEDGTLLLWPEEFYIDYFLDDLSEDDADAGELFKKLVLCINAEDRDHGDGQRGSMPFRVEEISSRL